MLTGKNDKSVTPQTTTENTDSKNNAQQRSEKKNGNHNNRREIYNNRNNLQLTNYITQEGDNSEVHGVIGIKIDNFHLKVPFKMFKDKVMNYAVSNHKDGGDMKPIFKKLEDPINAMTIKHKPRPQIKQFVSREYMLRSNMEKLYSISYNKYHLQLVSKNIQIVF